MTKWRMSPNVYAYSDEKNESIKRNKKGEKKT